jgi:hypothetical protein
VTKPLEEQKLYREEMDWEIKTQNLARQGPRQEWKPDTASVIQELHPVCVLGAFLCGLGSVVMNLLSFPSRQSFFTLLLVTSDED